MTTWGPGFVCLNKTDTGSFGTKLLAPRNGGKQLLTIIRHCKTEAVVMLQLDRTLPIAWDCLATVEPWESPFGSRQRMIVHSGPYLQMYLANQLNRQETPHLMIPLTQSNGSATFLRVVDAIELVHTEPTLWHIPGRQNATMNGPEGRVTAYIAEGP